MPLPPLGTSWIAVVSRGFMAAKEAVTSAWQRFQTAPPGVKSTASVACGIAWDVVRCIHACVCIAPALSLAATSFLFILSSVRRGQLWSFSFDCALFVTTLFFFLMNYVLPFLFGWIVTVANVCGDLRTQKGRRMLFLMLRQYIRTASPPSVAVTPAAVPYTYSVPGMGMQTQQNAASSLFAAPQTSAPQMRPGYVAPSTAGSQSLALVPGVTGTTGTALPATATRSDATSSAWGL